MRTGLDTPEVIEPEGGLSFDGFRLKPDAILIAFLLGAGILLLSSLTVAVLHAVGLPERPQMRWVGFYYDHIAELGYTLAAIWLLKKRIPGDYGLRLPAGKSYVAEAVLLGAAFGLLMTLIDFYPQILALRPPSDQPYPLTAFNIAGWISFKGVFVGPAEEVLFRGLLITYLVHAMPGRISWRGYSISGAAVVVAAMCALFFGDHAGDFVTKPFAQSFGQIIYTFAFSLVYAWWYDRSKSLLAPVIGHNVGSLTEVVLIFVMVAQFR
jgi:membrane protease YdiL (CAAX protease family)